MDTIAMLLADSRFPGGGHAHSGGLEEAAARGLVSTEDDLPGFLLGRLRTAGELAAVFAAAAAHAARRRVRPDFWARLDAELDARTPAPAQREASRAQGSGTLRALKATFTSPDELKATFTSPRGLMATFSPSHALKATFTSSPEPKATFSNPQDLKATFSSPHGVKATFSNLGDIFDKCEVSGQARPHHAIVVGVAVGLGGGLPVDAALAVAYLSVSGPASAAVRLLGLDPLAVNASVLALSPHLRAVAERAAAVAAADPADLPAPGAPGLDLLAEAHKRKHDKEVRLFAS